MTTSSNFIIREATINDAATILALIKDLAEYEKLSHEVAATEDDIRQSLFGDRPVAEALIGELEGVPISFALFFYNFSTFLGKPGIYLEDLYVKPDYRGNGFGRKMLAHIAGLAKERNCGRFEWSVLDWNAPAIRTYDRLNARPMKEWILYRLTGDALDNLAQEGKQPA
ncbi:MAG: GNAT family N-acetyltransferase [Deltaproteobacteria bacterium]|nr:GNAT family N-acetyltransferase [Deltaproteobacteria bacterium]